MYKMIKRLKRVKRLKNGEVVMEKEKEWQLGLRSRRNRALDQQTEN